MKINELRIGMKVEHPGHGMGLVKTISEHTAEIDFNGEIRTIDPDAAGLEPFQAKASITGLDVSLARFIEDTVKETLNALGVDKLESLIEGMAPKWQGGTLLMKPADPSLQAKDVPLDVFFHKIVMMRNNLRVLEQKVNSHEKLSDAEKVEMQQYVTRCYGSMTTFNILFRSRDDQFKSS